MYLVHIPNHGIADVYIAKDFTIINENNYKLIDRVFDLEPTSMDVKAEAVPKKVKAKPKKAKAIPQKAETVSNAHNL